MKKILSILIAMSLMISLFSGVAFAGSSSSGGMIIMRKTEEPAKEPEAEEATPAEATPAEPEAEETTPAEAEEVVEEATAEEPEEVVEEATPAEAVEEVEEVDPATGEEAEAITPDATASEATESEAEEDELGDLISESDYGAFKVYIYSNRKSVIAHGEIITLTCVTEGFDGYTLSYQWECDDGNGFVAVEGANAFTYSFAATAETLAYDWRVIVTATK